MSPQTYSSWIILNQQEPEHEITKNKQFPTNWKAGTRVNEWGVCKLSDHSDQCNIAASSQNTGTDTV